MVARSTTIQDRKKDHIRIATSDKVQIGSAGFERYRFVHNALPEINFAKIDTKTKFLGKKIDYPIFISCMTGGVFEGEKINKNLAVAAQNFNIPIGVGSQRGAIEHPVLRKYFKVRKYAPDVPVLANIGMVQLNYGFGLNQYREAVEMVEADALVVHLNPIQEVIQPEGDTNFEKLLPKLEQITKKIKVPVIVKEVGFGLSSSVVTRLYDIGIRYFDTAGWGGTNWALIEGLRGKADKKLGALFSNWGIPTTDSILHTATVKKEKKVKDMIILGSGGVRTGVDIAKVLVLGADLAGIAAPFAKAAKTSYRQVEKLVENLTRELRVAMFGVGAINLRELKGNELDTNISIGENA